MKRGTSGLKSANHLIADHIVLPRKNEMTTSPTQLKSIDLNASFREALVDKLRSCHTPEERLEFEASFNSENNSEPLYAIICDFLQSRYISRVVAAKWLKTLLNDRENKLNS